MADEILTLQELAKRIERDCSGVIIPQWKLRRVVDSLNEAGSINVQRVGLCRIVSSQCVATVAEELRRIGWMDASDAETSGDSDGADVPSINRGVDQRSKHSKSDRSKPSPAVGTATGKGRGARRSEFAR